MERLLDLSEGLLITILEYIPKGEYINIEGEELQFDCFRLIELGINEDFTFIQLCCALRVVRRVRFETWDIRLEWGVDDAQPEVIIDRLDLEDFIDILKLINHLPFYFEPCGKEIVQAWLYEEERLVLTYFGTIALDHPGVLVPFLFDRFELTLLGEVLDCTLEFWINSH